MTEEMTAVGVLSLLETNGNQRASFIQGIITSIREGQADPLKISKQLSNIQELIEELNSNDEYLALFKK